MADDIIITVSQQPEIAISVVDGATTPITVAAPSEINMAVVENTIALSVENGASIPLEIAQAPEIILSVTEPAPIVLMVGGNTFEVANYAALPVTGERNKVYITLDNNRLYRWTGSAYVELSESIVAWGGITGTLADQSDLASALAAKEATANKNAANGYAGLGADGKVASAQLPSYVDDVVEVANYAALPGTGETGKIYVTVDTNLEYRWSGSVYIQIVASPGTTDALTEGASNLYFTVGRVRSTVLTGLSLVTSQVIAATDTILQALGYLQAQITALSTARGLSHNQAVFTIEGANLLTTGDKDIEISVPDVQGGATIEEVYVTVKTAPTGAALRINVKKNGTSIFDVTQYVEIAMSGTSATKNSDFSSTALAKNDKLSIEIVQGDAVAANLVVHVRYKWTLTGD